MTIIPCSSSWLITRGWAHPLGTAPPDCAAYEPRSELQHALADASAEDDRALAIEFEVAVSTVSRWRSGTARPHPLLAGKIVTVLRERIAARAAARRGR